MAEMTYKVYVNKVRDKEAVDKLAKLSLSIDSPERKIKVSPENTMNIDSNDVAFRMNDQTLTYDFKEDVRTVVEQNSYMVSNVAITLRVNTGHVYLYYQRHAPREQTDAPQFRELYDLITIKSNEDGARRDNLSSFSTLVKGIEQHFTLIHTTDLPALLDSKSAIDEAKRAEYFRQQEDMIHKLQESATSVTSTVAIEIAKLTSKLQGDFNTKQQALDTDRSAFETYKTDENKKLDDKRYELAEMAHRELRLKTARLIKKKIENSMSQMGLSWSTKIRIIPAFLAYLTLPAVLLGAAIYLGYIDKEATINTKEIRWYIVLREIVIASGFVAAMTFFILWLRKVYEKTANRETDLKKLNVDMLRASWLYELVLEWKKLYPTDQIPEQFVERFSRDLFSPTKEHYDNRTPFDLLNTTKFKVTSEGVEFTLDDKDHKKDTNKDKNK